MAPEIRERREKINMKTKLKCQSSFITTYPPTTGPMIGLCGVHESRDR
jgi:hypothetical protein